MSLIFDFVYHGSNLLILSPDANECFADDDNCDVNADCTNTPGSFECMCRTGFEGSGILCRGSVMGRYLSVSLLKLWYYVTHIIHVYVHVMQSRILFLTWMHCRIHCFEYCLCILQI